LPVNPPTPTTPAPPPDHRTNSTAAKILTALGATRISKRLRIGGSVKVRVPGDDHDGHVGRIVELFSYEPGVIVRFSGDPDPYAFRRNELEPITPPGGRKAAPTQHTNNKLCPGNSVKIRVPGDDHDGHVGRIVELFSYEPGVIVRFSGDPDPYAFQRNELEPMTPSVKR
jgi:hypothetical protein